MNFDDSPKEAAFRAEALAFLQANAKLKKKDVKSKKDSKKSTKVSEESSKQAEKAYLKRAKAWQKLKYDEGWACLHWPKKYGGRDASPMELIIWQQEESKFDVPSLPFVIGQGMCGPTMMAYSTDKYNLELLPRMASGEDIWCQLFSEPSGGSDLANLSTKAEPDGDDWIINGKKIWASGAHYSDWGILVTRSDPTVPKHKGLTFFFLNMQSPGIEMRPIKQISGSSNFNEVFFCAVRIPDTQRLGAVGDGWKVSITTLMNERLAVGTASGPDFSAIYELASKMEIDGQPAIQNAAVRAKLANWYCEMSGLKYTKTRVQSALSRGATPGPENSIAKIVSAKKLQDIGSYGMDLMDMGGIIMDPEQSHARLLFQDAYMSAPGLRIAGGSDEILRNIIAERVLGLPQDVRVDKNIPFNEIPQGSR